MTDPNIDNDNAIDPVMSDLSLEDQAQLFQLLKVEAGMTLTMRKNGAVADGVDVDIAQVTFNNMDEGTKPLVVDYKIEGGTAVFQENKLTTIRKNTNKSLSSTVQLINLTPGKGMIKATPYLNPKMAPAPVEYEFIGKPRKLRIDITVHKNGQYSDGIDNNGFIATLIDENTNKPVNDEVLNFELSSDKAYFWIGGTKISRTTDPDGKATVQVKSSANTDISLTLTVSLASDPSVTQSVVVTFKARPPKLVLNITVNDQYSDGNGINKVTAKLTDHNNNPVSGAQLELKLDGNALFTNNTALSTKPTDPDGIFNVGIKSSANANISVKYTVTLVSDRSVTQSIVVNFKKRPPKLVLNITVNDQYSDGVGKNEVLATLTDHNNNPVSGAQLELKLTGNAKFTNGTTISTLPTRSDGTYNVGILSTANANISVTYTVTLVSDRSVTKSVDVRFKAKPVPPPPVSNKGKLLLSMREHPFWPRPRGWYAAILSIRDVVGIGNAGQLTITGDDGCYNFRRVVNYSKDDYSDNNPGFSSFNFSLGYKGSIDIVILDIIAPRPVLTRSVTIRQNGTIVWMGSLNTDLFYVLEK